MNFPMFNELQRIAFKHFRIDQINEQVFEKLGVVKALYLTEDLARGLDTNMKNVTHISRDMITTTLRT